VGVFLAFLEHSSVLRDTPVFVRAVVTRRIARHLHDPGTSAPWALEVEARVIVA
jgi:hypothetical protein